MSRTNIMSSLLWCIVSCLWVLAIITGIVWFFIWLFRGSRWHINVDVESATLARFDLDGNNTLHYNLTLGVSFKNPNSPTVFYDKIAAAAHYDGKLFSTVDIPSFTQSSRTPTMIYPAFQGKESMPSNWSLASYRKEKAERIYHMNVTFNTRIQIEWSQSSETGTQRYSKGYAWEANCALTIPTVDSPSTFNKTTCDVKFWENGSINRFSLSLSFNILLNCVKKFMNLYIPQLIVPFCLIMFSKTSSLSKEPRECHGLIMPWFSGVRHL